jgi:DNA-binding transcriptional LysR family regulator
MRLFQDLTVFRKLAEHVAKPNCLTSFLQLARRAKLTDDTARRSLERLKCEFNDPLLVIQDRHAVLTDAGRELLQLSARLTALAENTEVPPIVLAIESDSLLAVALIATALPAFLELWGSMVQVKVHPLQEEAGRRNVAEGLASFGVGFADGAEVVSGDEMLGPRVPWVLVMPKNHRLAGSADPVTAENLSVNDRVFIPEMATSWPGMDMALKLVPAFNRIVVCDAALAFRLGLDLGVAVVPDSLSARDFASKRLLQGIEPVQPRFILPRKGIDGLTEPEQSLVEQIRNVAEFRCKQETLTEETAAEVVVEAALLEEPARQLEGALP